MDYTDSKKNKTVQYLDEAIILLLQNKNYQQITVKNLIDKAGISRTSFYHNFVDIQDFFEHVIEDSFSNLGAYTGRYHYNLFLQEDFTQYYTRFYEYMAGHINLFATLMSDHGLPAFQFQMVQEATSMWTDQFSHIPATSRNCSTLENNTIELLITYIVSAHVGLVKYWLFDHRQLSPAYMAEKLFAFTWTILSSHDCGSFLSLSS